MDEQTVLRTRGKQTYESYIKEYQNEVWLTGTKSVAEGYADRIVLVKCDKTLSGVTTHSIEFMGMAISYDLDACPINTAPMNVRIGDNNKNLTKEVVNDILEKFMAKFENKQGQVTPLMF